MLPSQQQKPVQTIPGFQFLACDPPSLYCETWKARDPNDELWRIQFVHGFSNLTTQERTDSLRRLLAPHHTVLVKPDVLAQDESRVVLGSEMIGGSVFQCFTRCKEQGQPGIPRAELLDYLRVAAETVDTLYDRHNLQHLGLNPHTLLLDDEDQLRLADFGLAQLFWYRAGRCVAQLNSRYSAPGLFEKQLEPSCDQYSLALIYAEMLLGRHPFARQWQRQKTRGCSSRPPDLEGMSPEEQEILTRTLNDNPKRRFDGCRELIEALTRASDSVPRPVQEKKMVLPAVLSGNGTALQPAGASSASVVKELLSRAVPQGAAVGGSTLRYVLEPGRLLSHRCLARWPTGLGRLKLRQFGEQWNAPLIREDKHSLVFHVPTTATLWQRWRSQQPGLQVEIRLCPCRAPQDALMEVTIHITPVLCEGPQAVQLLTDCGPTLLQDLRALLYLAPERRHRDRVQFDQPLSIIPVQDDLQLGNVIGCHGKDLSPTGIGLFLPRKPATPRIYVQTTPSLDAAAVALLGQIVRLNPQDNGWFEAGVRFSAGEVEALSEPEA